MSGLSPYESMVSNLGNESATPTMLGSVTIPPDTPDGGANISLSDLNTLKGMFSDNSLLGSASNYPIFGGDPAFGTTFGGVTHASQAGSTGYAANAAGQATGSLPGSLAGLGSVAAGAAFFGLAGFVTNKLINNWGADNPALTFMGGDTKYSPITISTSGRDGSSKNIAQAVQPGAWQSEKFNFSIGTKDLPGGKALADKTGKYLDSVFTQMQETTEVDINKIIPYAFELTDFKTGTPEQMVKTVIGKVTEGIQTGTPLSPYYSRNRSLENTEHSDSGDQSRYVSGSETYDPDQEAYNALSDKAKGETEDPSTLAARDRKGGGKTYTRPTYESIQTIEGDANFVLPGVTTGNTVGSYEDMISSMSSNGGDTVTDQTTGTAEELSDEHRFFQEYSDRFFAEDGAEFLLQQTADHAADAANQYTDTLTGSTDKQNALLAEIMAKYDDPANRVNFGLSGQPVSFIPRTNRQEWSELAGYGQDQLVNTNQTAEGVYDVAPATNPATGQLAFLDALMRSSDSELKRDTLLQDYFLRNKAIDEGVNIDSARLDQNEPGLLDNVIGGLSLLDTGLNTFSKVKGFLG